MPRRPLLSICLDAVLVPALIVSAKAIGRCFDVAESIVGFVNAFEFACWIVANDRAHKAPSPPATGPGVRKAQGNVRDRDVRARSSTHSTGLRGRGGPSIVRDVAIEANAFAMTIEAWRATIGSN